MPRQSALAGQIAPIIEGLLLSGEDCHAVFRHLSATVYATDLAVLAVLGFLLVPALRIVHIYANPKSKSTERSLGDEKDKSEEIEGFKRSWLFFAADNLAQIFRLAILVYACDCMAIAFEAIGFEVGSVSMIFAQIIYASWLTMRLQSFKCPLVRRLMKDAPEGGDKMKLINSIIDWALWSILFVKVLQFMHFETGFALGSIVALGSTGTLIVSLASQEIAKGVLTGIEMASSDRFYVGENIHFGDGTQGFISNIGFLRSKIRKYDGSVVDVPNSQLGGQRLINVSRTKVCRVCTTVRFDYEDIQNIPKTLALVKEEIISACPKLIHEGMPSRPCEVKPFRAMISSFEKQCVEATINCSFDMPPSGEEFWANREQMYLAIDRGVRKSGIQYAKPVYHVEAG